MNTAIGDRMKELNAQKGAIDLPTLQTPGGVLELFLGERLMTAFEFEAELFSRQDRIDGS